tara:strand:- start:5550 stop:9005 length:3456 start_codon:yes stop_codon:yes gene_type:complete
MAEKAEKYQKITHIEHVLKRPDTYIGSVEKENKEFYIFDESNGKFIKKQMEYIDGFMRIHMEIIYNAIDNIPRSCEHGLICDMIKIEINENLNKISVTNNGLSIPITQNNKNEYIPEIIFGNLMAGSNFDDKEDRYTTGRNGLGAKLTNIFSKYFEIEINDPQNEQIYKQIWGNNMSKKNEPTIKKSKLKTGYVKITWTPDFEYFKLKQNHYTDDHIDLIKKIAYDIAGNSSKCTVMFNNTKIKFKSFFDYCKLYHDDLDKEHINIKHKNIELIDEFESNIVITAAYEKNSNMSISFINNLYTIDNGKHYQLWSDKILNGICQKLSKKNNIVEQKDIKKFFNIFVSCRMINPTFKSQSKNQLTGSKDIIDTDIDITTIINKIYKWDVINNIKAYLESKEDAKLKKTTDIRRKNIHIENYDAANKSGTKYSKYCSLLLCEGLSAKTYAVVGMSYIMSYISNMGYNITDLGENDEKKIKGRDWMGIYPLRGVPLNSRNATNDQILKNREITDIIKILNVEKNVDYTIKENFDKLTYGKIVILTDADVDGTKIKGLLLNIFHDMFKSLLSLSYIVCMKTPILKINTKQHKDMLFYNEYLARRYIDTYKTDIKNIKYYKGLGTSNNEDIKQSFAQFMETIKYDDKTDEMMEIMFNKKKNFSDDRKCLIEQYKYNINDNVLESINKFISSTNNKIMHVITNKTINISNFIKNDMVEFSIANCKRTIPHIMDGLKQSQRKILYGVFVKNVGFNIKPIKVAQLSGYVSENTNYHHGEQNLCETIIKMAQSFVGTNNISLLYPEGQFGSRLALGEDAASPRYIFTKLNKYTRIIFNDSDDNILTKVIDDGDEVEPEFYVPIIPMILVNGCKGIATGFSTEIINFNIHDIIEYIKFWLINDYYDNNKTINPWYKGFEGSIKQINEKKWETYGSYNYDSSKGVITVSEIPILISINDFKECLDKLIEGKKILSYNNYSTENKPYFEIKIKPFDGDIFSLISKSKSYLNISNMTLFDINDALKKFDNVYDIIQYYCNIRYEYYEKRKKYLIDILEKELIKISNKHRFILHVIEDNTIVFKKKDVEITQTLEQFNYDKIDNSYEYLLSINIKSFTYELLEKLNKLLENKKHELSVLKSKKIKDIWLNDLDVLIKSLKSDNYFN